MRIVIVSIAQRHVADYSEEQSIDFVETAMCNRGSYERVFYSTSPLSVATRLMSIASIANALHHVADYSEEQCIDFIEMAMCNL